MDYKHIHVDYVRGFVELSKALRKLKPDQVITIVKDAGYTIVWKSNNEYESSLL
ncbi:hypothetical protein [Siminovitchia fordii]|uniref:Uncharacterized protein n=1 Tax=Siminovitchia fordii TaxID=254759 RepID=A0ABQ4KA15_9BACI|nr:hypothetical protein [Siminovitchia fordii]GIN22569.1 hypothetical protein J1TS3_37030 [Siminovitchia fordii]